jgi:hypothetical protein
MSVRSEKGAVLVEWAIVVVGLTLGTVMMVDIARALSHYMSLTMVAREAARSAAGVPEFEVGSFTDLAPTAAEKAACENASAVAFPCAHDFVQDRTRFLIQQLDMSNVDPASISVTTEFIPLAALGNEQDDTIILTIEGEYQGFIFFAGLRLSAQHQGPYLFQR